MILWQQLSVKTAAIFILMAFLVSPLMADERKRSVDRGHDNKRHTEKVYSKSRHSKVYRQKDKDSKVVRRIRPNTELNIITDGNDIDGWVYVSLGGGDYGYIQIGDLDYPDYDYGYDYGYDDDYDDYYDYDRYDRHRNSVRQMREAERMTDRLRNEQHQLRPQFDYQRRQYNRQRYHNNPYRPRYRTVYP